MNVQLISIDKHTSYLHIRGSRIKAGERPHDRTAAEVLHHLRPQVLEGIELGL